MEGYSGRKRGVSGMTWSIQPDATEQSSGMQTKCPAAEGVYPAWDEQL